MLVRIRYLAPNFDEEKNIIGCQITNTLLSIKEINESSTAAAILSELEKEIFTEEAYCNNLISISHDRGSNLAGQYNGLISILKRDM